MSKFTQSTRAMVILLVALFMSTSIVAADYIGPQRTYEIDVPSSCHMTYSGSGAACGGYPSNPVSCTCNIYCDDCLRSDLSCSGVGEGQVEAQCGHKDFSETDREVVYKTVTRSYPIAVASTS